MNKQELIKYIEDLPYTEGPIADTITINRNWILELIKQLDEPQKVVVPQFVADWIEKCKTFKSFAVSLSFALQSSVWEANSLSDECIEWLTDAENQEIFARAWLDGYEVEKEKQYEVSIKASGQYLARNKLKEIKFMFKGACSHFTRTELEEAGFGWVFDCPGIEIKEV